MNGPKYLQLEDWLAVKAAGGDAGPRPGGVVPPKLELPDIEGTAERLLTQQTLAGAPNISWGPPPSQADANRRKANLALEKLKLRPPLRWRQTRGAHPGSGSPPALRRVPRPGVSVGTARYAPTVKHIATGRLAQVAGKYSEHAPMTAVCCNACRTCVQTNVFALAMGGAVALLAAACRLARRFAKPS